MTSSLVIIGPIPEPDRKAITSAAQKNNITLELKITAEEVGKSLTEVALGYISYLPCNAESVLELFSNLPIGASEHFPFFQNIQGEEYPEFLNDYPISGVFTTPINFVVLKNIFNNTRMKGTRLTAKSCLKMG